MPQVARLIGGPRHGIELEVPADPKMAQQYQVAMMAAGPDVEVSEPRTMVDRLLFRTRKRWVDGPPVMVVHRYVRGEDGDYHHDGGSAGP